MPVIVRGRSDGSGVVRQHVLRGVTQGQVVPHCYASVNGTTYTIPCEREIPDLPPSLRAALIDAGYSVTDVIPPEEEE